MKFKDAPTNTVLRVGNGADRRDRITNQLPTPACLVLRLIGVHGQQLRSAEVRLLVIKRIGSVQVDQFLKRHITAALPELP